MKRILMAGAGLLAIALATTPTLAADMPVRPVTKAPPAMAAFSWAGPYAGLTAGYGWGRTRHCENPFGCTQTFDMDGWVAGGTLGYNWQSGMWVAGVEADISFSDVDGTLAADPIFGCAGGCKTELDWFATARLRAGPAFDRFFPYLTGGVAFGRLHASVGVPVVTSGSDTKTGWTVGAGAEYAFAPNWSLKLEYLYIDFGSFVYDEPALCGNPCSAEGNRVNIVRGGLNYRFATY